ncbi:hypothetical protein OG205_16720 [Lentzea sp. NBC_00516]|uniref:hypothetical protein n=1 Tax=Lentzea sp. NBC_00516 TaxID=2903582 RepID=UPI002E81D8E2|nr:hypothetical protein [Lentzea sp. NBC_00516]WUD28579.1 hypothetical protein OG205_16720 [Lentzea sp. NBC_00516]
MLPVGVAAAVVASAGIALLTASPAAAATCKAPAGSYCVGVNYQTSHVKSIRLEGRCLLGPSNTHSTVHIVGFGRPDVQTYGGTKCESNTHNSARVIWRSAPDSGGYRWVSIY